MKPKLTPQHTKILAFLKRFIKANGYPPTRKEIADNFGWFPNAAQESLHTMADRGFIKFDKRGHRNIVLL